MPACHHSAPKDAKPNSLKLLHSIHEGAQMIDPSSATYAGMLHACSCGVGMQVVPSFTQNAKDVADC